MAEKACGSARDGETVSRTSLPIWGRDLGQLTQLSGMIMTATMSRGIADGRLPPNNPGTRPCSGIMPAELPESHGQNEKENGARLLASRAEISGSVITTAWPRLQRPGRMLR